MVLFVDLSSPPPSPNLPRPTPTAPLRHAPNRNHPLSALLATYPFLESLARSLDHNDLYNLSSVCWQFHANMSAYRRALLSLSLHCRGVACTPSYRSFTFRPHREPGPRCVRDLVNECLRCKKPVCRNCINKPSVAQIHSRHRRLCQTCRQSPSLVDPTRKRCYCANGGWVCVSCAPAVIHNDDTSLMRFVGCAREFIVTGRGPVCCVRGSEECEGMREVASASMKGSDKGSGWMNGAPVEWDVEMTYNRWALVDEWQGVVRSWCSWCDAVILSKEDESQML